MNSAIVKGHKGIRIKENGKYLAAKSIKGKKFYKEFSKLREAVTWKNEFHPLISPSPALERKQYSSHNSIPLQSNGINKTAMFSEIWKRYQEEKLPTLSEYTQYKKLLRMNKFAIGLLNAPLHLIDRSVLMDHLKDQKLLIKEGSQRCNFDKELKDLASIFSWYEEEIDTSFKNPVRNSHFEFGRIREVEVKEKIMSIDQLIKFFDSFEISDDGFMFQSLAIIGFYMAGRIQEAAALNDKTIDLNKKLLKVTEKIIWIKGKPIHQRGTKTGETGSIKINEEMEWRIRKLKELRPPGCKFLFQRNGKPLRHGLILKRFNSALQSAGFLEYSGTHFLRFSMATLCRELEGLDASQAILRHTTARMSEHYAKLDANEKVSSVVIQAEALFKRARVTKSEVGVTKSYQKEIKES